MSNRNQRTIIGVVFTGFLILTMGIILYTIQSDTNPILDPVPPCDIPPQIYSVIEPIQAGNLNLSASANATGMMPHQGPIVFVLSLRINITNTGNESIGNFQAIKISLYTFESELFYTFSLQPDWNATISAGESMTLIYRNEPTRIDTLIRPFGTYGRVLVTFDVNELAIITTQIAGLYAVE